MSQLALPAVRPALYEGGGRVVREADRCEVDWMIRRHYLRAWPGVVVATLGLYRAEVSVGVIVFSLPPPETFVRYGGVTWELGRLWIDDAEPRNTESWFIARAVRYVRRFHPSVFALVSYADPSAGHIGTIYKASNWLADGRTDEERQTPRFDYEHNGKRFSRRAHVPEGVEALRVPRVSKYRYWLPLRKPAHRLGRDGSRRDSTGTPRGGVAASARLATEALVYDPFVGGSSEPTRTAA